MEKHHIHCTNEAYWYLKNVEDGGDEAGHQAAEDTVVAVDLHGLIL